MATINYLGTPGTPLYAGLPTPPAGNLLQTLRLVNTSSSAQSADFVTKSFGLQFKEGDIPAGAWPYFRLENDAQCPATISEVTTWPDGSMKKCAAFLRVPASVPGSASYSATVAFDPEDADVSWLPVQVRSAGAAPAAGTRTTADLTAADLKVELTGVTNISGTWLAELNAAITSGANIVRIAHGPAGSYWRIHRDFHQGGSPHGQMHCDFYIFALTNAGGGLSHLRRLESVRNGYAETTSPASGNRTAGVVVKSGATTLRTMEGYTDRSGTLSTSINMPHWAGLMCVGTDGEYEFLQGGGSATADCTIRVVHEPAKVVRSKLVQPFDTSIEVTPGSQVSYYPNGNAGITWTMGVGGDRPDIGVLPTWACRHLITQSGVDERNMICAGLAASGWGEYRFRSTTKAVIPVSDVRASYVGMGDNQPTWVQSGAAQVGFSNPSGGSTTLWELDTGHRPSTCYYPYLMTGRREFIDMAMGQAASFLAGTDIGTYVFDITEPITNVPDFAVRNYQVGSNTYKNAGCLWWIGGARQAAWSMRDIGLVAGILPDVDPAGTEVKLYFTDAVDQTYSCVNDLNSTRPQSWRDSGLFSNTHGNGATVSQDGNYESPWMTMYLTSSVAAQSMVTPIASVQTFRTHLAKFISSVHANMDNSMLCSYRWKQWTEAGALVMDVSQVTSSHDATITYSASTNRGTVGGALGLWAPQDGDLMAYIVGTTKPFPSAEYNRNYVMVNCVGQTFQLSETLGGSVIDIPSDVSITGGGFVQLQDSGSMRSLRNDLNYVNLVYNAARTLEACGDSFINAARVKQDTDVGPYNFIGDPRNAMLPAYPA